LVLLLLLLLLLLPLVQSLYRTFLLLVLDLVLTSGAGRVAMGLKKPLVLRYASSVCVIYGIECSDEVEEERSEGEAVVD
jgi:hypothetical protein